MSASSAETASPPPHSDASEAHQRRQLVEGVFFGILAAVGYTVANMALRSLSRPGDFGWSIWITFWKAHPAAITAWVLIAILAFRGKRVWPKPRQCLRLLAAGFVMQFLGNLMFQNALGFIGLGPTVPLTFATLITSAAVLGRVILGEAITKRSMGAMSLLIIAIVLIQLGTEGRVIPEGSTSLSLTLGVLTASIAGLGYGLSGVIIRQTLSQGVPLPAALVFFSTTGSIGMGLVAVWHSGWGPLWAQSSGAMPNILLSGTANCVAFFAVGAALNRLSVTRVNLINATQIAMCATVSAVIFHEPVSRWLVLGILLTIAGQLLMDDNRKRRSERDAKAGTPSTPASPPSPLVTEPTTDAVAEATP